MNSDAAPVSMPPPGLVPLELCGTLWLTPEQVEQFLRAAQARRFGEMTLHELGEHWGLRNRAEVRRYAKLRGVPLRDERGRKAIYVKEEDVRAADERLRNIVPFKGSKAATHPKTGSSTVQIEQATA